MFFPQQTPTKSIVYRAKKNTQRTDATRAKSTPNQIIGPGYNKKKYWRNRAAIHSHTEQYAVIRNNDEALVRPDNGLRRVVTKSYKKFAHLLHVVTVAESS